MVSTFLFQHSVAMDTASRQGRLDDDFVSSNDYQGSPHSNEDIHNVSRLSDVSNPSLSLMSYIYTYFLLSCRTMTGISMPVEMMLMNRGSPSSHN